MGISFPPAAPVAPPGPHIEDIRIAGSSIKAGSGSNQLHADFNGKVIDLEVLGEFGNVSLTTVAAVLNNGVDFVPMSASRQQLVFQLDTTAIPDLYLAGPHKMRVRAGELLLEAHITVGAPDTPLILFPELHTVTVQADGSLEIIGQHFMRNPFFAELRLNQSKLKIVSVSRQADHDRMVAEIDGSLVQQAHELSYATPFGNTRLTFNH